MLYKKIILIFSFLLISGFLFNFSLSESKAMTVAEIEALIAQLQQQIAQLQQRLAQIKEKPVVWCHDFKVNLKIDMSGPEVRALQTALEKEGFYKKEITGKFDEYTASAVVGFQEKYKEEVLTPWGLEHGTGFVGPTTRAKLNELYGCEVVEETECERNGGVCIHFLNQCREGYQIVNFACKSRSEKCCMPVKKSITVISPNGGERWIIGESYQIVWEYSGVEKVNIELENWENVGAGGPLTWLIAENISASLGNYSWTISESIEPKISPSDFYKIRIVDSQDTSSYSRQIADSSDNYFSIEKKEEENLPPVIDELEAPTHLKINQKGTWTIRAHDPENGPLTYLIDWGDKEIAQVKTFQVKTLTQRGIQEASFTHSYSKAGNYTVRFIITDDHNQSVKASATVEVISETCHTSPLWSWDYCSPDCKCKAGEGDCDSDADCLTGYCAQNVGEKYGQVSAMDVCEEKEEIPACTDSDGGEDYYVKGTTVDPDTQESFTDYCTNSSVLREYFCLSPSSVFPKGSVGQIDYVCPYGCEDGACKTEGRSG